MVQYEPCNVPPNDQHPDEISMITQILTAVLHKDEDLYVAECPEVGTVSQGYSVEEVIANLREPTELYLEEFPLPEMVDRC